MSDATVPSGPDRCPIVELRQYTLHPGRRDELIELFDREFVETQEAAGMCLIGQFRDLDDPDRFVWLRGFTDMESRRRALEAFYDGPVWARWRDAANATMVDWDGVLLLRPASAGSGFAPAPARPPVGGGAAPGAVVTATILPLRAAAVEQDLDPLFEGRVRPLLRAAGATPVAWLRTEPAENTYPRLPVRTGETVCCWLASWPASWSADDVRGRLTELERSDGWGRDVGPGLQRLAGPARRLVLEPTPRSSLGHGDPERGRPAPTGDVHDFDFIAGPWQVAHRRLRARGAGCDDWDEFTGSHRGLLLLDGLVDVDEVACPSRGFSGMSIRLFDRGARQWSIRWISSVRGVLEPPVVGGFAGDRGEFYGDDVDGGRPVRVRFLWHRRSPREARWEQAFSYDGERTWETNWVMEFTRPD